MKKRNSKGNSSLLWTVVLSLFILVVLNSLFFYFYFTQNRTTVGNVILNENTSVNHLPPPQYNNPQEVPSTGKKYSIDITSSAFSPQTLRIQSGDTVYWTNRVNLTHTVTSSSGAELSSGFIEQNQNYIHTFNDDGFFEYYSTTHPDFTGTIIVESS